MTEDRPFDGLEGRGPLGEFSEEMKEVYNRLLRDAVTVPSVMAERVAGDETGRRFDDETRETLVEMLVRAARQRDEPLT